MEGPFIDDQSHSSSEDEWSRIAMMDEVARWVRSQFNAQGAFSITKMLIMTLAVRDFLELDDDQDFSMLHIFLTTDPDASSSDVADAINLMACCSTTTDHYVSLYYQSWGPPRPNQTEVFNLITVTILN